MSRKISVIGILAILLSAGGICGSAQAQEALFDNRKTEWKIYLPAKADPVETYASEELQVALKKISGVDFMVVKGGEIPSRNAIILGSLESSPEIKSKTVELKLNADKVEQLAVYTIGNNLYLAGNNPRGCLYAVYSFLEKELGVRWLWPGDDGEFMPAKTRFALQKLAWNYAPSFRFREMTPCGLHKHVPTEIWMARNFLNNGSRTESVRDKAGFVRADSTHSVSLSYNNDPEKEFKSHPEYFSMVNGARVVEGIAGCWSNPGFEQKMIQTQIALIKNSNAEVLNIFPADVTLRCECRECTTNPDPSSRWFDFYHKIILSLKKEFPDLKFGNIAYQEYRAVPATEVKGLEYVEYCQYNRCYVHKLDDKDCQLNAKSVAELKEWQKKAPMGIYGYEFDVFEPVMYVPLWNMLADEIKAYRNMKLVIMKTEMGVNYSKEIPREDLAGTNDAPVIATIAQTNLNEQTTTSNLTSNITASFSDVDLTDVGHTAQITAVVASGVTTGLTLTDEQLKALISIGSVTKTSGSAAGSVPMTFTAASTVFDYLAVGQIATLTYTLEVNDGDGGTHTKTFVVQITGTNDLPILTATNVTGAVTELGTPSGNITDSGTIAFSDVDLSNTHTVGVSNVGTPLGSLGTVKNTDTTGNGTGGQLTWTYTVAASAVEYLAQGETKVEQFDVSVNDGTGSSTQQVSVTITGTNDAPTITGAIADFGFTETTDAAAQDLSQNGTLSFDDIDATNVIDVTKSLKTQAVWSNGTIDSTLKNALEAGFSISGTDVAAPGSVNWAYNVADASLDFLAKDETVTLAYTVTVTDNNGLTATDDVTITISGTNDTPDITATDVAGAVMEDTTTGDPLQLRDNGSITFTDLDTTDTSDATVALFGTPTTTTGQAIPTELTTALASALTISGDILDVHAGTINWNFALDNSLAQYLAAGETVTATYRITVTDDSGVTIASGSNEVNAQTQAVTVTITGTNDAPVLVDKVLAIEQTEDDAAPVNGVTTGSTLVSTLISGITDVDVTNPTGIAITATDSNRGTWWYSTTATPSWTSFTVGDASTARLLKADANTRVYFQPNANWHGSVTSALTIRAWDGSSGTNGDTANITATDGTTAFSAATDTVSVTVSAVNDQPTITSNVTLSAFTEDVNAPSGRALSGVDFGYSDATDDQNDSNTATLIGGNTSTAFTYLAVVGSTDYVAGQGTWQISTISNPTAVEHWIDIPTTGLSNTSALIFNALSLVRFVPAGNYFGTPGTLTVRLADASFALTASTSNSDYKNLNDTANGDLDLTTGAWSSTDRTLGTTVSNVNDAPTISDATQSNTPVNEDVTTGENGGATV